MKVFYIIVLSTILFACSNNIEQSYKSFDKFSQATLRQKSWFPELIGVDCHDLREIHNIDNNKSYGKFSYETNFRIDSLLSDRKVYEKITIDTLNRFLDRIGKPKSPNWFLTKEKLIGKDFYRKGPMYLINNYEDKMIYFAYSTE